MTKVSTSLVDLARYIHIHRWILQQISVTVEYELCTRGLEVAYSPQEDKAVPLLECNLAPGYEKIVVFCATADMVSNQDDFNTVTNPTHIILDCFRRVQKKISKIILR